MPRPLVNPVKGVEKGYSDRGKQRQKEHNQQDDGDHVEDIDSHTF